MPGFSEKEKEAMRERAKELAAETKKGGKKREEGMNDVIKAIEEMPEPDKTLAKQIHQIVAEEAPDLWPKTWYGMPAYAIEGKKVVVFFQAASKFESRYSTLGFNDAANLDEDNMWAASFAVLKITGKEEKEIRRLVKKAVT